MPALRCRAASRIIDTLHPVYEGRAFFWDARQGGGSPGRRNTGRAPGPNRRQWQESPFYHLLQSSDNELRRRLETGEPTGFAIIDELRREGQTDYIAMVKRFGQRGNHRRDGLLPLALADDRPGGFADADLAALRRLVPLLGLAVKSTSLARVAAIAGRNLSRPRRRPPRAAAAACARRRSRRSTPSCGSRTCAATRAISEDMASDQLIPLLDDYAEAVISAMHGAGGDVLKLIGDGVLAIFARRRSGGGQPLRRCRPRRPARRLAALNERRAAGKCRSPRSISGCISATSSTAISAARTASTSRSSARR